MTAFLSLFLHVLVSPFKTQARLEAEIVLLRHQLNVLRRRVPATMAHRLLFVWLHRLADPMAEARARWKRRAGSLGQEGRDGKPRPVAGAHGGGVGWLGGV
jgi:hypothetical protein